MSINITITNAKVSLSLIKIACDSSRVLTVVAATVVEAVVVSGVAVEDEVYPLKKTISKVKH